MLAIEQYTRRLLKDFHPIVAANRPPVDLAPDAGDRERFVRGSGGQALRRPRERCGWHRREMDSKPSSTRGAAENRWWLKRRTAPASR